MLKRVTPENLKNLSEGEAFLTAGKITKVNAQENRTIISIGETSLIHFNKTSIKQGDTARITGRQGREMPIADSIHKVNEKYPQLLKTQKEEQLVEDLGGI